MTNAAIQAMLDTYGDRVFTISLDNNRTIFLGYNGSLSINDIELMTIGNIPVSTNIKLEWRFHNISDTGINLINTIYNGNIITVIGDKVYQSTNNGETWITHQFPDNKHINAIAYGNNLFVAVGDNGVILTSPDCITWTDKTLDGINYKFNKIIYTNNLFVAVGDNGVILTSPDGIVWTKRTSGTTNNLNSIAYGNKLFVVIGTNGIVLYSNDAINWNNEFINTNPYLKDIAFGNDLYVVLSNDGIIYTSSDASEWTRRLISTDTELNSIAYCNKMFVVGGSPSNILVSSNGITWKNTKIEQSHRLNSVASNGTDFIIAGDAGTVLKSSVVEPPTPSEINDEVLAVHNTMEYNGEELHYTVYHDSPTIQWVGIMSKDSNEYRPDPIVFK